MDIKIFWDIIDTTRNENIEFDGMYESLVNRLAKLEINEIFLWHNIFCEYQELSYKRKIWAAAYVICGGCSDDWFDYFRAWLTSRGKTVFLNALKDPETLCDVAVGDDYFFEEIMYVAKDAYCKKMRAGANRFYKEEEKHFLPNEIKNEMLSEIEYGQDIDMDIGLFHENEDTLRKLLPKLSTVFDF